MSQARYVLLKELGEGGMGKVYLAEDTHREIRVVLKSLLPQYAENEELRQRFYREAQILSNLSHPAIVKLYDFFIDEGSPYMVMEYLEGQPLDTYIERKGSLSPEETYTVLAPVLDALGYMHGLGVIHRDLKPSNIMVLSDGQGKLLDFGIAKTLDSQYNLTRAGFKVGTVLYMAPEQIQGGEVSPLTDLYAMGLVIYQCLFGRYPWDYEGKTEFQLYETLLKAPLPVPAWAPQPWKAFIEKALARPPQERFPSAKAMKAALQSLSQPPKAPTQPETARKEEPQNTSTQQNITTSKAEQHLKTSKADQPLTTSKAESQTPSQESYAPAEAPPSKVKQPVASSSKPASRLRRGCLTVLRWLGILLLVGVGIILTGVGIYIYSEIQTSRRNQKIRALLMQTLQDYAKQSTTEEESLYFDLDALPEKGYEEEGLVSVPYRRGLARQTTIEEETQEPCSKVVYYLFGQSEEVGKRTVWVLYQVTQTCREEGSVDLRYRYLPERERVVLEGEPEWHPYGKPTCEEVERKPLKRWEGDCEIED